MDIEERTIHLKIKIKSLADEARTIRKEANKTNGMVKWNLNEHRTKVVRPHTRHNLLAYGILIGTPYEIMENKCHESPKFSDVSKIAKRFGAKEETISEWIEKANSYISTFLMDCGLKHVEKVA